MSNKKVRQAVNSLTNAMFSFMVAVVWFVVAVHNNQPLEWVGCVIFVALTIKYLAVVKYVINDKAKLEEPF